MSKGKGTHLTYEMREVIERGLAEGESAAKIARRISVSVSTVTREVKNNRTLHERKAQISSRLAVRCSHYKECSHCGNACQKCVSKKMLCKHCRRRDCIKTCPSYERRTCPQLAGWPYVCPPGCPKRAHCGYPWADYGAKDAQALSGARLRETRRGADLTEDELLALDAIVSPLVRQGHSFGSIWAAHKDELPVTARTLYNYQEAGLLSVCALDLPRKARMRPRRRKEVSGGSPRIDRSGREYKDFLALPLEDKVRVVQADSVVGFQANRRDILSLHLVARKFQLYLLKAHQDPGSVVARLDEVERALGSPEAFGAVFGIMLVDRGVEFDDWRGMEASCLEPDARRCRVFYCDAMKSNQKSACERNHEQLRRILPQGRSDFDSLSEADVALCTSHVNSYPLPAQAGRCAFELAGGLVAPRLLAALGIHRIQKDRVILRPSLLPHAVRQ